LRQLIDFLLHHQIERWQKHQRQQRSGDEAADDDDGERTLRFRTDAMRQRHRQQTEDGQQRRHQHRAQTGWSRLEKQRHRAPSYMDGGSDELLF
jgi:hypothetical protein